MKSKKQYMLTLAKPFNPPVDFPLFVESTGLFSYRYHIKHSDFYGTRMSKWRALLHMLLFKLYNKAKRSSIFKNKKVWGKLILVEVDAKTVVKSAQ